MIKACNDELARELLVATARSVDGAQLRKKWTTSGGRLRGEGANTTWDLAGATAGVYQAFVEVDDGRDLNCVAFSFVAIVGTNCPPPLLPPPIFPTVTVSCPETGSEIAPVPFTEAITGGTPNINPDYN